MKKGKERRKKTKKKAKEKERMEGIKGVMKASQCQ